MVVFKKKVRNSGGGGGCTNCSNQASGGNLSLSLQAPSQGFAGQAESTILTLTITNTSP